MNCNTRSYPREEKEPLNRLETTFRQLLCQLLLEKERYQQPYFVQRPNLSNSKKFGYILFFIIISKARSSTFQPLWVPSAFCKRENHRENEIEILKEHQKKQKKNSIKAGTGLSETKTSEIPNHPTNKSSPL